MHRAPKPNPHFNNNNNAHHTKDDDAMTSKAKPYRNDPYAAVPPPAPRTAFSDDVPPMHDGDENAVEPPAGTLHSVLWGQVSFTPYPDEEFAAPRDAFDGEGDLVRVFLGQLPYFVTDMQLAWLCFTFGGGHVVSYPERIMKRQANGERLPTGCIHAYCTERAVAAMADGMHKRMLIDDTGVWHAQSADELEALNAYVTAMKRDKSKRVPNRPYDTIVVQFATSTYVPRHVAASPQLANAISTAADVIPDKLRRRDSPPQQHHQQHPSPQQQQRGYDPRPNRTATDSPPMPQPHLGAMAAHVMTRHGYTPAQYQAAPKYAPPHGYGYEYATAAAPSAYQQPPPQHAYYASGAPSPMYGAAAPW